MPSHQVIVTPWRYHSELVEVKDAFYRPTASGSSRASRSYDSSNPMSTDQSWRQRQSDACETVRAWELLGNVPHAVVATAELTAALLFDRNISDGMFRFQNGDSREKSVPVPGTDLIGIRLGAYMSAWTRFIDGMTDTAQDRRVKRSMYSVARELGMPIGFIELRHRAVHEGKPMLHEFRREVREGLAWLFRWYWTYVQPEGVEIGGGRIEGGRKRKGLEEEEDKEEDDGKGEGGSLMNVDEKSGKKEDAERLRARYNTLITTCLDAQASKKSRAEDDEAIRVLVDAALQTRSNYDESKESDDSNDDGYNNDIEDPLRIFADCILCNFIAQPQSIPTKRSGKKSRPSSTKPSDVLATFEPILLALAHACARFALVLDEVLITTVTTAAPLTQNGTEGGEQDEQEEEEEKAVRASAAALLVRTHQHDSWAEFRRAGLVSDEVLLEMCRERENRWTRGLLESLGFKSTG